MTAAGSGAGPAAVPAPGPGGWAVERHRGSAAAFHGREVEEPVRRSLWLSEVDRPALVLGSAQRIGAPERAVARAAALGLEVVRRRSGGSAVLLEPGGVVWADLIVGRDDVLWDDDVGRATWWVGEVWRRTLATLGLAGEVHRGPMRRSRWSDRICFAGLGPGEVTVDGRKVVGISQRRTRAYARFQTAALLRWEPGVLVDLFAGERGEGPGPQSGGPPQPGDDDHDDDDDDVDDVAALWACARPLAHAAAVVEDALIGALPD